MDVVQCMGCGGRLVYDADAERTACVFCASVALEPAELLDLEEPEVAVPFRISEDGAARRFGAWATSSWWYPKALRRADLRLSRVYIPAWKFEARVGAHYAGLASADTRSGKRPESGAETMQRTTWVAASLGLSTAELEALSPFHEDEAVPWSAEDDDAEAYETSGLSERAARTMARDRFETLARNQIARRKRLSDCKVLAEIAVEHAALMLLPVYVGSFRFRNKPWRFVVNAQTGRITGEAPLDRTKIAFVVAGVLLIAMLWWIRQGG